MKTTLTKTEILDISNTRIRDLEAQIDELKKSGERKNVIISEQIQKIHTLYLRLQS